MNLDRFIFSVPELPPHEVEDMPEEKATPNASLIFLGVYFFYDLGPIILQSVVIFSTAFKYIHIPTHIHVSTHINTDISVFLIGYILKTC